MPYNNVLIGVPDANVNWDSFIQEQIDYFSRHNVPFVWYVDEDVSESFKQKLSQYGFKDVGVMQGVTGPLDLTKIEDMEMPEGCEFEQVYDNRSMDAFNDLVCDTFGFFDASRLAYGKVLWDAAHGDQPTMFHWTLKKDGRVVSAVSTLIEGQVVSFWNGATRPELRRQGLSYALRSIALKDAVSRGCLFGTSYLMAGGMALGICKKFGYQSKWRFHAFLAP